MIHCGHLIWRFPGAKINWSFDGLILARAGLFVNLNKF